MAGFTEEEYEQSQGTTPVDPPKGSRDWAEQNSGGNAPQLKPTPDPAPGTLEAHEQRQGIPTTNVGIVSASNIQTQGNATALSPEQQRRVDATAGTDRQIKTIQDWMDAEGNRPETDEERKKRERREKSKRIIAAVSDGISALSNLYFTSQYAPNMYDHEKGSMTSAVDARLERLKAEREKNADKYLQFSLKLGDLENQRAATLRELEAQQERQKLAREKAQREAEAHGWTAVLQPDKQREQAGKAAKAEQEAIAAQAEAEAAPELQRAKIATERARKGSLDASAANSRASAAAHGRSNVSEFSAWDEHGKEHKFRTKEAAEAYAKQHGTWKEEDVKETTTTETKRNPKAQPQTRTSTKTKKGGHAGKPSPTGRQSPTA
ncbi:hypothetical protein NSB20_13790 [Bacteroides acidifaciens]|uniref:hypothetical protein n=1 Tax=Bacteroides acidifaciens TaxID=85831 RepID=UPI00214A82B6|nr:hypothetical protein [Bacteroides acidifaciens]MCR2006561.1 hypothetical protein [Bacteroides acidifaciens]